MIGCSQQYPTQPALQQIPTILPATQPIRPSPELPCPHPWSPTQPHRLRPSPPPLPRPTTIDWNHQHPRHLSRPTFRMPPGFLSIIPPHATNSNPAASDRPKIGPTVGPEAVSRWRRCHVPHPGRGVAAETECRKSPIASQFERSNRRAARRSRPVR